MIGRHSAAGAILLLGALLPLRAAGQVQVTVCREPPPGTVSITGRIVVEAGEDVPTAVGLMARAESPTPCSPLIYAPVAFDWSFTMSRISSGAHRFYVSADRAPFVVAARIVLNGVEKAATESFLVPDGTSNILIYVKKWGAPAPTFDTMLATDALVTRFKEERWDWIQFDIGRALVERHDSSILTSLESWLTHDTRRIRGNAAFVFAGLGDSRGFQTIVDILNDRSDRPQPAGETGRGGWTLAQQIASDRFYAAHLLGELRDPRAIPILVPLLRDSEVDYTVPWSLGQIGDARAIPPLIEALSGGSASTKVLTIYALEKLLAKEALPHLRGLVNDTTRSNFGSGVSVADAARSAIAAISGTAAAR